MAVWQRHFDNFREHDTCPYYEGTIDYNQAMEGPPSPASLRFRTVEGCVPPGFGDGWAFPKHGSSDPKVNLQVLWEDLTYLFSRLCLPYGTTTEEVSPERNVDDISLRLIGRSQKKQVRGAKRTSLKNDNENHVKTLWTKVIVHLAWMITMNRNHFPKPPNVRTHGGMSKQVLEVTRANCKLILKFLRCTVRGGHNGRYFLHVFENYCWPVQKDLSPFAHDNATDAYNAAFSSWKSTLESIKLGLCASYDAKFNMTTYWRGFKGSTKTPAWAYVGIIYSMFDHKCRITSGQQLWHMHAQGDPERTYNDLRKWGYFTQTWNEYLKNEYNGCKDVAELDDDDKQGMNEIFTTKYSDLRLKYSNDQHPITNKTGFPQNMEDGRMKFLLFGCDTQKGWLSFVESCLPLTIPRLRWKFSKKNLLFSKNHVWDKQEMKDHSDEFIASQAVSPVKPSAQPLAAAALDYGDSSSESDADSLM